MLMPFKDDRRTQSFPLVTIGIVVVNVLVFFYQLSAGQEGFRRFVMQMGLIPYELTHFVNLRPGGAVPLYLTPLTAMFVHGGILHLFGNMLYLWIFGDNIEDVLGHLRFLLFYLGCGIIAAGVQVFFEPNCRLPMIGASGAVAGVLGAYLVCFPTARVYTLAFLFLWIRVLRVPALLFLGLWFLIQLNNALGSSAGGIAWFAHIGGFLAGVVLILKYGRGESRFV
ncbi:MAG: rhomboid family intramembrane serine protease [Candidatus Latescibacterota bacterium]|nr:MAG: rhomboid family intramembrane serine protease [Candidatus Latescibacterota bacterium]